MNMLRSSIAALLCAGMVVGCAYPWTKLSAPYRITNWPLGSEDTLREERSFGQLAPTQHSILLGIVRGRPPFDVQSMERPIAESPLKAVYEIRPAADTPLPFDGQRAAYRVGSIPNGFYRLSYVLEFEDGSAWVAENVKLYDLDKGLDLTECRFFRVDDQPCDDASGLFLAVTDVERIALSRYEVKVSDRLVEHASGWRELQPVYQDFPLDGREVSLVRPFDGNSVALVPDMRLDGGERVVDGRRFGIEIDLRALMDAVWSSAEQSYLNFRREYPPGDASFSRNVGTVFIVDRNRRFLLMARGVGKYAALRRKEES